MFGDRPLFRQTKAEDLCILGHLYLPCFCCSLAVALCLDEYNEGPLDSFTSSLFRHPFFEDIVCE